MFSYKQCLNCFSKKFVDLSIVEKHAKVRLWTFVGQTSPSGETLPSHHSDMQRGT